jgi:hypothetical protein
MQNSNNFSPEQEGTTIQKDKFPVGMIVILVLVGGGILPCLSNLKRPMFVLGPFIVKGAVATIYPIIMAVILGLIFYGILKRKTWGGYLTIVAHAWWMWLALLSFLAVLADKQKFIEFHQSYSPDATRFTESYVMTLYSSLLVFSWIIGIVIIAYVYRKRDFFKN